MEVVNQTKEVCRFKTVTINKLENGYLLSCISTRFGEAPKQEDFVFTDFPQVIEFLSPQRAKLVSTNNV